MVKKTPCTKNSGLVRVTNPDLTWKKYLYNSDGLYAGIQHYSNQNVVLRGVQYKDAGPGEVQMVEYPNKLKSILKYNIYGELQKRRFSSLQIYQRQKRNYNLLLFGEKIISFLDKLNLTK